MDIIIVNWNSGFQLFEAVSSIARYHGGVVSSVIIVDNASEDDSLVHVDTAVCYPFRIKIIHNNTVPI